MTECSKTTMCRAMSEYAEPAELNPRGVILIVSEANHDTSPPTIERAAFILNEPSGGAALNFCPWCRADLRFWRNGD